MKVLNIHKRRLDLPKVDVVSIIRTLSTENDRIWPREKWPRMKFEEGIQVGAVGGHGPIGYSVEKYDPENIIQFRFLKPGGFIGIHKFEIKELTKNQTLIKHTIDINTEGKGTWLWLLGIRSLHDALIEDAFDKLENNFAPEQKYTKWSFWVKFLRQQISRRAQRTKEVSEHHSMA